MSNLVAKPFSHDPSDTAAFEALSAAPSQERVDHEVKAVVIGGGTGAPVSIRTLLSMGAQTSAVVAMADDGGSTGILRDKAGATAPGDIRKCITAMAGKTDDPLTKAFKVRFGFANNHTLGNLMLSALEVNRVTLVAKTSDGRTLEGQAVACHSRNALKKVALESDSKILAYEPACEAIRNADLIVLGPGSLFTSIIPNLIVPGIIDAIRASKGATVFVCSLADMQGETRGLTPLQHYEALCAHGMRGLVDYMLAQSTVPEEENDGRFKRLLVIDDDETAVIEKHGTRVLKRDLVDREQPTWHDPVKLRKVFAEVLK